MSLRWQSLIFIVLILISVTVTKLSLDDKTASADSTQNTAYSVQSTTTTSNLASFDGTSLSNHDSRVQKTPTRKWDVLDPQITADGVIVHSLDDGIPLFYKNSHEPHVLASLTKLLTSVVVFEDIGLNKKISISQDVVDTQGFSGHLKTGEVYTSRDLAKLMLLTSSNDSAAAFEDYLGGKEQFVEHINDKMNKIGMTSTVVHDGSGLSDFNKGNASDLLKLVRYILKNHPKIFSWTRSEEMLIQPMNGEESRRELNINPLVSERNYLGGKTGTSQAAGQNLVSLFNFNDRRVVIILLGSQDRKQESLDLLDWANRAYKFN